MEAENEVPDIPDDVRQRASELWDWRELLLFGVSAEAMEVAGRKAALRGEWWRVPLFGWVIRRD